MSAAGSPAIFISYRRKDTLAWAHLLREKLTRHFETGQVFLDTSSMAPATDFPDRIQTTIANAKILVVLIGKFWLVDQNGNKLFDSPKDWIRQELTLAQSNNVQVAPVLFDGCDAATLHNLPAELAWVATRHCLAVHPGNPEADTQRVAASLAELLPNVALKPEHEDSKEAAEGPRIINNVGSIGGQGNTTSFGNYHG